jgi:hypothetical protein
MLERRETDRDICEEVIAVVVSMSSLPLISEACLSRCGKTNRTRVDCQLVLCAANFAHASSGVRIAIEMRANATTITLAEHRRPHRRAKKNRLLSQPVRRSRSARVQCSSSSIIAE